MKTHEVFGPSPKPRDYSYVDRGQLDGEIARYLQRDTHLALRGESKCGKSWLRQRTTPDAIVVQCRLAKSVVDLYVDILAELDITLAVTSTVTGALKGKVTARGETGLKLLAKVGVDIELAVEGSASSTTRKVGHDVDDLRFVADIVKASGRRLVIEDFHYLTIDQRKHFAFDLKALWDFGLFVTIIGIWTQSNMLLHLNPDLSARVHEISLEWTESDLRKVIERGGGSLGLAFSEAMTCELVALSVGNVGILQKLALMTLDACEIFDSFIFTRDLDQMGAVETAALLYAEQLNPLYQQFARSVSNGIRTRKNSTGIYAHAMAVIMDAGDQELRDGLHVDRIFELARARQSRIQRGNLKAVLEKMEELQVDKDGRGLVISYNEGNEEITIVDRQLLLYRRFCTVKWPWEELIAEVGDQI